MADMRHTLDKKTVNRHFPEYDHGGKGGHARRVTVDTIKAYSTGWDKIFNKGKDHGNDSST